MSSSESAQSKPGDGIENPQVNDVLSGRGNFANYHPGNTYFRQLVKESRMEYVKAPKDEKGYISDQIVDHILSLEPPGRFLKQDPKTKLWHELPYKKAVEKTRQALRENAPELRKELQGGGEGAAGKPPREPDLSQGVLESLESTPSKIEQTLGTANPDILNELISASAAKVNGDSSLSSKDMECILKAFQSHTSGKSTEESTQHATGDETGPTEKPRADPKFHSSIGTIDSNKMMTESMNLSQITMHESFQTMRTITSDIFSDSENGKLVPAPLPRPSRENINLDSVAQQKMDEINSSVQNLSISLERFASCSGNNECSLNDLVNTAAHELSLTTLPAGNTASNDYAKEIHNMSLNLANYSMKDGIPSLEPQHQNPMQMSEMSMSIASIGSFEVPEKVETSAKPEIFDSSIDMNTSQMIELEEFQ